MAAAEAALEATSEDAGTSTSAGSPSWQQLAEERNANGMLSLAGFTVEGISVAGQETCIILPQLKLVFDTGRCPQRSVYQQTVLLSHGHLDHVGGLPFHVATRSMLSLPPSIVLLPAAIEEGTRSFLDGLSALNGGALEYELKPCQAGKEVQLGNKHFAVPFPTSHPVASQGYVVYSRRQKLKAHLVGKPSNEIRDLKLSGQEVSDTVDVPEVAFTGDTSADFLTSPASKAAFRAKLLIMELTFLESGGTVSTEHAREMGHMHIDDFIAHADKFQNECILLIHFSARYSRAVILDLLAAKLPDNLRSKCVPLLEGFR
ncbi:hypothetical protein WJX72_011739 [[Myrmecia] bisecta]|uniref:Metallo-beta-lactamase domain-containing protein n=1 Tax=[Myrmecia] bisecta TaxID=41462 RepID=A0AAW1QTL0_9CHLO